ncbi:MAG: radical SAM family heme chaperone HemW [Bacteroidales bacterium]|nr:radical SAM family heme chaperone HemW [Bacteroidales bacterium]
MAGIYLHIPFCLSKCIYCGFYSNPKSFAQRGAVTDYISALKGEIQRRRDFFSRSGSGENCKISTLYIGGGTPSLLSAQELSGIKEALCGSFDFAPHAFTTQCCGEFEFTMEVNPNDITPEYAKVLKELGVNRISMGVQSFCNEHLIWMGRRHRSSEAVEAFNILRAAGFGNIGLDLIFGYPALTMEQWRDNIERLIELQPEHISAYQLSIDAGTELEKLCESGAFSLPDEEVCRGQYALLQELLGGAGYIQYEISNFAREGDFISRHNSNYWKRVPYMGLGPSAHSFVADTREWNIADTERYCNFYNGRERSLFENIIESEHLSEKEIFNETLMLGLRQSDGIEKGALSQELFNTIQPALQRFIKEGVIIEEVYPARYRIHPNSFFISDYIISSLFV